ncbi:MAG: hypothetical protein K8L97_14050 [Anaerolineae bacterium]|nr:hypothetical protein [Anaerolineae bacterium]
MQRKWILIPVILVLALSISITTASPTWQARYAALESLAPYFPADAVAYAAVRTDGAYVEVIDSLVNRFLSNVRELNMIDFSEIGMDSVQDVLDAAADQFVGRNFDTGVRPWLGDAAAMGLVPYQDNFQVIIALSITDQVKATSAITPWLTRNNWVSTNGTGYTLFTQDNEFDATTIAVFPEALLISSRRLPTIETKGKFVPDLTANFYYNSALALLPEDNYDLIGWVDTPLVLANAVGADNFRQTEDKLLLAALIRLFGPTAFGGTITGDNVIALDMAQAFGNKVGLESLGITLPETDTPLDPAFLSNIPSDSVFVAHGTDLDGKIGFMTQIVDSIAQNFAPFITPALYGYGGSSALTALFSMNSSLPDIALANIMGLSYERDLRPWLTSDYAIFGGFNPGFEPGTTLHSPIGFGAAFKSSDPAAAANFVRILGRELPITLGALGSKGSFRVMPETLASGTTALSITLIEYDYTGQLLDTGRPIFEYLIGANESLVVFGTRDAVQSVLSGDVGGFQPIQTNALPNTGAAVYANFMPILDILQQINPTDIGEATYRDLRRLASLVDGLTLTAAGSANDDLFARLTVTLR